MVREYYIYLVGRIWHYGTWERVKASRGYKDVWAYVGFGYMAIHEMCNESKICSCVGSIDLHGGILC